MCWLLTALTRVRASDLFICMDLLVLSPTPSVPALRGRPSPWVHPVCDSLDFLCRLLWAALLGGLIAWLVLDTSKHPEQLISLAGFCVLVLFLFACSKHHSAVGVSGAPLTGVASAPLPSPDGPLLELPGRSSWAELVTSWGDELVGWMKPQSHLNALLLAVQPRAPQCCFHLGFYHVPHSESDPGTQHQHHAYWCRVGLIHPKSALDELGRSD